MDGCQTPPGVGAGRWRCPTGVRCRGPLTGRRSRPAPHADLARDPREPDPHLVEDYARIVDVVEALSPPLVGREAQGGIVEVAENLPCVVRVAYRYDEVHLRSPLWRLNRQFPSAYAR